MALDDLSKVTQTLIWLLENAMPMSSAWPAAETAKVSALPPDLMPDDARLGLYLYHVTEDPHFKNDPSTGIGGGTKRDNPLALSLYYQLTVASVVLESDPLRAQTLLGIAMRVMHDFAIINDEMMLGSNPILGEYHLLGRQNRLRITLRPVPPDDAVDYWTAGEAPLRLSAYYQVSVVMLEAEPALSAAGPVLSYGTGLLTVGAPHLTSSRARLSLVVGAESTPRDIAVSPAQVTLTAAADEPNGRFELQGSALTGDGTTLRLRGDYGTFEVDAASWGVVASPTRVFARVHDSLGTLPTMPGTWSVSVLVQRTLQVGASVRTVTQPSNEMPILIAPRLDATSATGPTLGDRTRSARFSLTGWRFTGSEILANPPGEYPLPDEDADPRAVRLFIGGLALARVAAVPTAGQFAVVDALTLEAWLPEELPLGSVQPVQVWVNGAASATRWLRVVA